MIEDPIVAEIRRYRKQHSLKYRNNLGRICEALRKRQMMSERKVVTHPPRLHNSRNKN